MIALQTAHAKSGRLLIASEDGRLRRFVTKIEEDLSLVNAQWANN